MLEIQRETAYSQNKSVTGNDGDSFRIVHCWRKNARGTDWNIAKTVTRTAGQINIELSETEASRLPFVNGYCSIYSIDSITGRKSLYETDDVRVEEGTAGTDYTAVSSLAVAVPWMYSMEGGAQIDILQGYNVASADGLLTRLVCGAQDCPIGNPITFEIRKNGIVADTIILSAGDNRNTATCSISVAQGDYIEAYITSVGGLGSGTFPWLQIDYQSTT